MASITRDTCRVDEAGVSTSSMCSAALKACKQKYGERCSHFSARYDSENIFVDALCFNACEFPIAGIVGIALTLFIVGVIATLCCAYCLKRRRCSMRSSVPSAVQDSDGNCNGDHGTALPPSETPKGHFCNAGEKV